MKKHAGNDVWKLILITFVFLSVLVLATPRGTTLWLQGGGFQVHLIKNSPVLYIEGSEFLRPL
jgi:hypothetical protein